MTPRTLIASIAVAALLSLLPILSQSGWLDQSAFEPASAIKTASLD